MIYGVSPHLSSIILLSVNMLSRSSELPADHSHARVRYLTGDACDKRATPRMSAFSYWLDYALYFQVRMPACAPSLCSLPVA